MLKVSTYLERVGLSVTLPTSNTSRRGRVCIAIYQISCWDKNMFIVLIALELT